MLFLGFWAFLNMRLQALARHLILFELNEVPCWPSSSTPNAFGYAARVPYVV